MANYRLPLDLTGTQATNRVSQTRTLNMATKQGDKFFIPENAPFFAENCVVFKVGTPTPLTRGVDYELVFDYPDLFRMTQKNIYGGVKFKDRNITGQVRIEMQALGGPFLQPVQNILETTARNKTNVSTATWGEIAGVPAGFPVLNHPMDNDDFTGFSSINTTLQEGVALILAGGSGGGGDGSAAMAALQAHLRNPTNAHNKAAVGLGNVSNFAMSTYAEADLGVNNRYTSPAMVKYLISRYAGLTQIEQLQTQLAVLSRDVAQVQQGQQETATMVANIDRKVKELSDAFTSVKQEFGNVLNYVSDLGLSIENIQNIVENIRVQMDDALDRVAGMESVVAQLQLENANISTELSRLSTNIGGLDNRVSDLEVSMEEITKAVNTLNEKVLYPINRYVNAGTYNFSIKPGETRFLTLFGAGGAGGLLIPVGEEGMVDPRGLKGGDTFLVLNTDVSNGTTTNGDVVLRANGGWGGQSSKQSAGGVDKFGQGGAGGTTLTTGLFSIISNAIGAGGQDGNGSPGPSHPGAAGHVVNGKKYCDGGAAPISAGAGGAGAMVKASIKNTYTFDLEFTVVVGVQPSNIYGNNYLPAAPGLFIINNA